MSVPDFSLRPFAAGTVTGLRAFSVSPGHQLTGVVHPIPWFLGENNARCIRDQWPYPDDAAALPGGHRIAGLDCTCGFYAYFDNSNDYYEKLYGIPKVTGIVEAYGTVTIGSRGFRASKARIVAIVRPHAFLWLDQNAITGNYPGVPVYATVAEALAAHPTTKPQDVGINPRDYPPQSQRYAQGGIVLGPGQRVSLMNSYGPHVHFQVARSDVAVKAEAPKTTPPTPVERKRAAAQAAAENRARAGLSNLGGINRRRRNP